MLLEVEPSLEGDVADGAADPPVSHQLGQVSFLQDRLHGPPTYVWTGWTFLRSSCHSSCTGPGSRAGLRVAGHLVPWEAVYSPIGFSTGLAGV